jgi:hypothetical protein
MSYFNNKGELNASSVKEALAQIAKFASVLEDNSPSDLGMNAVAARNDDELVSRALNTSEGKLALASSMANPIRKNLDYHGIARRALVVEALAQGAIASYERDIDVAACVVSSNGGGAESRVFGERITVPEYELFSNPTVRWKEVKSRRFNVIDRAIQKASQEIQAQEDANVFAALDAASSLENTVQDLADSGVMKRDLINMKRQVDHWDLVTAKYFMNINEFTDLLQWGSGGGQGVGGGDLDPVSMREVRSSRHNLLLRRSRVRRRNANSPGHRDHASRRAKADEARLGGQLHRRLCYCKHTRRRCRQEINPSPVILNNG